MYGKPSLVKTSFSSFFDFEHHWFLQNPNILILLDLFTIVSYLALHFRQMIFFKATALGTQPFQELPVAAIFVDRWG